MVDRVHGVGALSRRIAGGKMSMFSMPQGVGSPNQRALRVRMVSIAVTQPPLVFVVCDVLFMLVQWE